MEKTEKDTPVEFASEKALTKALKSWDFSPIIDFTCLCMSVQSSTVWEWGSLAQQKEQGLFSLDRLRFEPISVTLIM